MIGLVGVIAIAAWLAVSATIAIWTGNRFKKRILGRLVALVLVPVIFVLPVSDEVIGRLQFDRLCQAAEQIEVTGTIPVGQELYTAEGRWRLAVQRSSLEERKQAKRIYESLVRKEHSGPFRVEAAIPIRMYEYRIYARQDGRILASYRSYATSGGWLSRYAFEKPVLVRNQCFPPATRGQLNRLILPFRRP
jgi:hypothetical protein